MEETLVRWRTQIAHRSTARIAICPAQTKSDIYDLDPVPTILLHSRLLHSRRANRLAGTSNDVILTEVMRFMEDHRVSDTGFERPRSKRLRDRIRRRYVLVAMLLLLVVVPIVAVPMALQNRDLVVGLINRNAGISPMRIDLASMEGGWLRPLKIRGLKLIDDRGAELVQVGSVDTELNLLSLIVSPRNLGTITIRDTQVLLDVQPGTTNIEEAIKPLLAVPAASEKPTTSLSPAPSYVGRIRIADAIVHARDSVEQTAWEMKITEADIPLPTAEQSIPPMTLVGVLVQTATLPGQSPLGGQFTVRTQPVTQNPNAPMLSGLAALRMSIITQGMPLQWISLVKRRLPDLPIERVDGHATVQAEVEFPGANSVLAIVQTAQLDQLQVSAPTLLGERGARMQQIKLSGDLSMSPNRMSTRGAKLDCDVGTIIAKADLAWPIVLPNITQPWIADSDLDIQGTLNLPQLSRVAPDLLKMQDQVELVSGVASLNAMQRRSPRVENNSNGLTAPSAEPPASKYQLQLGSLQANVQGKMIRWDQALQASVDVIGNANGTPSFKVGCTSEFCNVDGSGDLRDGRITAQLDLDKMEQRLSQWFVLPLESLGGSAQASVAWTLDEGNRLAANGSMRTTPVRIVHKNGNLDEPAWDGEFAVIARLDGASVLQVDRGQASLKSNEESLVVQILEPLSLASYDPKLGIAPAAGLQVKFSGELSRWQRRGQLFAGIDPGVQLAGRCVLDARGAIDTKHLEISQVEWTTEPFRLTSAGTTLQESRMIGRFTGRIDTQDLAKLQVDNLLVQSESFALQAQDAATPNQTMGRTGQAAFRIDPSRLIASVQSEPSSPALPGASPASAPVTVTGDITGQMNWTLDPQRVVWKLVSDGKNIRATQGAPARPTTQLVSTGGGAVVADTVLWDEPQVRLSVDGEYNMADGNVSLPQLMLQTEWLAYGGQANIKNEKTGVEFDSKGEVAYDASSVAQRLKPYTGGMVAIEGQRTQPLEVSWKSSKTNQWADSLQARSSIGWDRANVVGIEIGGTDIPITIENGKFASQASFPVSQGTLRWNLDGDLAATPMVIRQAPERVIENVAITRQMCQGWLKYVAPLLADVTSVQGNLSLDIDRAEIMPTAWERQTLVGKLHVHGANVGPGPLADQLLALVQQIRNLRRGAGAADGGGQPTSWLQLPEQNIGFAVEQGRVAHRDMQIQAGDVIITTSGSVGVDGSLELIASVPVQKDWVDKTPSLQSLAGQQIQVPIRGTIQRPQLDLAGLVNIGQNLATSALQGVAQKQIDRGLNKLLGPLSNQLGPLQQGVQQMQQGVQQNLQQLPLPNLPIPGFGAGGPFGGTPASPPAGGLPPVPPGGQ